MYQIHTEVPVIRWDDDGTIRWIPLDELNTDYQAYLAWVAEGNEPLPWPQSN